MIQEGQSELDHRFLATYPSHNLSSAAVCCITTNHFGATGSKESHVSMCLKEFYLLKQKIK